MINLLIVRHGNTFDPGDILLRVGKKTDLPLSNSGREQAKNLGIFLTEHHPVIDRIIVSQLQRTQQTASLALPGRDFEINAFLDEIDYGLDEGRPETAVIARIGESALQKWEEEAIPPEGWNVEPKKIIQAWQDFAAHCLQQNNTTILVVTSNGIARFAPALLDSSSSKPASLKMKTGAISCFQYTPEQHWQLRYWNKQPHEMTKNF